MLDPTEFTVAEFTVLTPDKKNGADTKSCADHGLLGLFYFKRNLKSTMTKSYYGLQSSTKL